MTEEKEAPAAMHWANLNDFEGVSQTPRAKEFPAVLELLEQCAKDIEKVKWASVPAIFVAAIISLRSSPRVVAFAIIALAQAANISLSTFTAAIEKLKADGPRPE